MNIKEYKNKMINKFNAITVEEYKDIPYGKHFGYARTTFKKGLNSVTLYVPHQKPEDTFEEDAFNSYIPEADLSALASGDSMDGFRIGNNLPGGQS